MKQSTLPLTSDHLPYPTDADFAEENPGKYHHTDQESEAMWNRIWKRWKDRSLCYDWFKYRRWYSLEAWEYAFKQLAKKKIAEVSHPAGLVRGIARSYEADPAKYQQMQEAAKPVPGPKPVQLNDDQRQWWVDYYARQAAKKQSQRKTG